MLEKLLFSVFGNDRKDPKQTFAYNQFMEMLESTTEDLTKALLTASGSKPKLSYHRVQHAVNQELKSGGTE